MSTGTVRSQTPAKNGNGGTAVATKPPEETFFALLDRSKSEFTKLLGDERKAERIARICRTAWQMKADLRECVPLSVVSCAMKALELGLDPDGAQQHAHLIAYWDNDYYGKGKGAKVCTLQIGYRGFIKLANNTGQFQSIEAIQVHEGDEFEYWRDPEPHIIHKPGPETSDAKITHVYCYTRLMSGALTVTVMTRAEIAKHEACAKRKEIWRGWWGEQAAKTVIKRHLKRQPSSPEVAEAIEHDNRNYDPDRAIATAEIRTGSRSSQLLADVRKQLDPPTEPEDASQEPPYDPADASQAPPDDDEPFPLGQQGMP